MVRTWEKPKYAPFEEQAEQEQRHTAVLDIEPEEDAVVTAVLEADDEAGKSQERIHVDLLEHWFMP